MHADIWFDGASKGNPGKAGAGAVVVVGAQKKVISRPLGTATNNEAEYAGLIAGLEAASALGATDITVHGDSQLIIRQLEGAYLVKAPNLKAPFAEAKRLLASFDRVRFRWIRREQNAAADAAANDAIA